MKLPSVFIGDDDGWICMLLGRILKLEEYDVHCVQSVNEAINVLADSSFDVYLLDYRLQDGTGLELANYLRGKGCNAPIILISGYYTRELEQDVKALNIFRVVKKPFTAQTIRAIVDQALAENSIRQLANG
jgi:DNA-binding NtrC family response regulator